MRVLLAGGGTAGHVEPALATADALRRLDPDCELTMLGTDPKWSYRYEIRKALVLNPLTPRAVAAAQLRFLRLRDLRNILQRPDTSVYIRRCIERTHRALAPPAEDMT